MGRVVKKILVLKGLEIKEHKMDILKLVIIFAVIVIVMRMDKPIYIAMLVGSLATIFLFGIGLGDSLSLVRLGILGRDTIYLVLAFYTITFLQRMLEKREHLILAEESLTNIFNSRRVNAMIAPFVIGLLPSPGAVLIASPIVDNAAGDYLKQEEKTFVTSFFRHISEAFMPTYAGILLAINLSGVDMTAFVFAMLPMVLVLFILGYLFYVRKIPKTQEKIEGIDKANEVRNLIKSLWTIALTIVIILSLGIPVHLSVIPVIILSFIINKFTFEEIKPMFISAFEKKLIFTSVIIMIFKELLNHTGVIEQLPYYFNKLPISAYIVFGLIMFFGTLLAGSQAMVVLLIPLAFGTITNGGLPLLISLMCMTYIAMQISPTHICLAIITEHHGTPFASLVRETMPILILFIIISSVYSYLLYIVL